MNREYFTVFFFALCALASTAKGDCAHDSVRLVNSGNANEGTLELCLYAQWGTVYYYNFYSNDAKVICRMLGYDVDSNSAVWTRVNGYNYYGAGSGIVWSIRPQCDGSEDHILDCNSRVYSSSYSHSYDVGVRCTKNLCTDGHVRLVGGLVDSEGTVEICQNGAWNSLCYSSWGYQEAFVVCRQLGLPATNVQWYTNARFGEGHGIQTLTNWKCFGNESSLTDCIYGNGSYICDHSQDVGVSCQGEKVKVSCINGSMRLVGPDGPNMVEGRVEYCSNGLWGTVSDDGFDSRDGEVVCRRLGYQHPRVQLFYSSYYGQGEGPIVFYALGCDGTESKLEDCTYGSSYNEYHYEDIGLHCYERELISCNNDEVRLVNGSSSNEGRVEVCIEGEWGAVDDSSWDKVDAQVVCKQLGYEPGYATPYYNSYFGDGSLPVLVEYLSCSVSDTLLSQCSPTTGWSNALFGNTAGIKCYAKTGCTEGEVRLVGGKTDREGDVQICHNEVWGYICDFFFLDSFHFDFFEWNDEEAKTVCQQLNYSTTWYSYSYGSFFYGDTVNINAPFVLNVDCYGTETKLSDCSTYEDGDDDYVVESYCSGAAGVMCEVDVNCTDGSVQLVDGDSSSEGRVEFCSNGVWTTIWDYSWDYNNARVVCRQLGYDDQWAVAITGSFFTSGHSRIYYYYVNCNGEEQQLSECSGSTYGVYNGLNYWYNYDRAGVACEMNISAVQCKTNGTIRLVDGVNEKEGRVEVCMGGYWGSVCSDGWSEEDALVVCRQAGYDTLRPVPLTNASFGRGSGPVHMTSVSCTGDEERLSDCEHLAGVGAINCHHARDAGVVCTSGTPEHYSIQAITTPSKGPFTIGSVVHLHCQVSPDPPPGSIYFWRTSVPGVSITQQSGSNPNATITILTGHTKYGYYYCEVQKNASTLATGFTVLEVKPLLFSSQLTHTGYSSGSVTLNISKTVTNINSYLHQLIWYHNMASTDFEVPLEADNIKYLFSSDNMSLTIMDLNASDAGVYTARYDGLLLYPHSKTCEQQLLRALRHYPVLEPVTFTLSVDGSDDDYFRDSYSYFVPNAFTTSLSSNMPITINTTAINLPTDTIDMTRLKEGTEDYASKTESLFFSAGAAYSELRVVRPGIINSGNYETQLHLTTLFNGYQCNSIYYSFLSSYSYLGIESGIVILQSTLQRMAYYESPEIGLTSNVQVFDSTKEATLQCTATGGYPPIHNMSLVKNSQVLLNMVANEITYTTSGGLPQKVYGSYTCIVNNTAGTSSRTILLQHKAPFSLLIQVDNCDQWNDEDIEATEVAILGLIQTYCECSVDTTKFHNSTASCSRGTVTFFSTLAHASDDGSVTAAVLIDTFEAALARADNPTITVDGQELAVSMQTDDNSDLVGTTGLFFAGFAAAVILSVVAFFIIVCIVVMCKKKKKKSSSKQGAREDYIDMQYNAKTESLKSPKKPRSQTTSPSHQHYTKPPITAIKPTKDIELKENDECADDMYESI